MRDEKNAAHARLSEWAQTRAVIEDSGGLCGDSQAEKMRERAQGGSSSTAPHRLSSLERFAIRHAEALQTERLVLDLTPSQRAAIHAKYLGRQSIAAYAKATGIDAATIRMRLDRALRLIGSQIIRLSRTPAAHSASQPKEAHRRNANSGNVYSHAT